MSIWRSLRDGFLRLIGLTRGPRIDRIPDEPSYPHDARSLYHDGECNRCGYRSLSDRWRPCVAPQPEIEA